MKTRKIPNVMLTGKQKASTASLSHLHLRFSRALPELSSRKTTFWSFIEYNCTLFISQN
jgi:hypothetical protein